MALNHDPRKRVRVFSPLGYYPQHSITIPGARLLVRDDLVVSAVQVEPSEVYGFNSEHTSDFEFLAVEETQFLAAIVLAVHPDDGMAHTYPLSGHVDVGLGLDDDALIETGRRHVACVSEDTWLNRGAVLPSTAGGPAYSWRESGVNIARVLDLVRATVPTDHLLMRGLGALLQADMCFQHLEVAEAAVLQLYVALEVSFRMVMRVLWERGVPNPSAVDAGALIDEVFNPEINTGSYFGEYYESRVKTMHPSSRFGVYPVAPLLADDYFFLRHGMVEVYHRLITKRKLEPDVALR